MSKYTEGPWQHLGDPEDDECRVRQTASVRHGDGFYSEITICENIRTKANADLIAAAPDLLEALEALAEYVDRMHRDGHIQRPQQSSDAVRAIAKARGESQ